MTEGTAVHCGVSIIPGAVMPRRFWRAQTGFLAAFLLFALPLIVAIAFSQDLEELYWDRFVGARLRTELGFETGLVSFDYQATKYRLFGITSVSPGGVFDRVGLRAGDVIAEVDSRKTGLAAAVRHGRVAMMFYSALDSARTSGPLSLAVVPVAGLNENWRDHVHSVIVPVPRRD